jgi:hypothetical protein
MQFTDKHSYSKNSDTVMKMYSDRAFFERKYKDSGYWDIKVLEHEKNGDRFRIKCQYTMKSSAPVPGFAKKFLPETATVVQEDSWDCKTKKGRLNIEMKGLPAKITCDMTLKDEGGGAANHFKWDVSVKIPLVGGKIEDLIAQDIRAKSKGDLEVSRKILESY